MDLRGKIEALLESDLSGYQVNKLTGISASKFTRLRSGANSIDNLSMKTAEELGKFYDASVLDLVAQGDEKVAIIRSVLGPQFDQILNDQLDLAYSDEGTSDDIRVYNVLYYLFNRVLNDNELLNEVAPYYLKTKPYNSPYS